MRLFGGYIRACLAGACFVLCLVSCGKRQAEIGKDTPAPAADTAVVRKDSATVVLAGRDSVSVFDLLKEKHRVQAFNTSLGEFVKGIDSLENGPAANWIYTVNDSAPQMASDKYFTHTGDRVVWHYRKMTGQ